jgi:hypothetical protein
MASGKEEGGEGGWRKEEGGGGREAHPTAI